MLQSLNEFLLIFPAIAKENHEPKILSVFIARASRSREDKISCCVSILFKTFIDLQNVIINDKDEHLCLYEILKIANNILRIEIENDKIKIKK